MFEGGLQATTVNISIRSWNVFLHWLHEEGHTKEFFKMQKVKEPKKIMRAVPEEDVRLCAAAHKVTLDGRLNGVFRPQITYVDFEKGRRWYTAPALSWEMRPATSLTLLSRLQLDRRYVAFPLPAKGTVIPNRNGELPIERFVGEPSRPNDILEKRKQIGYQLTHRFNETFSMQQNMRLAVNTLRWDHLLYPSHLSEDERTLYRYLYNFDQKNNFFRIDTPLQAAFRTGSIRHQTVVGIDYYRYRTNWNGNSIDFSDPTAYIDAGVSQDTLIPVGTRMLNVPRNSYNLWNR